MIEKEKTGSEFGKGFVYCLCLFAQHFENDIAKSIGNYAFILGKSKEEKELILCDKPDDKHNYGFNSKVKWWLDHIVPIFGSPQKALSHEIDLWANGASDHLYEIEVPISMKNTPIEEKVKRLQDKALLIGHGFVSEDIYNIEDFYDLKKLTNEIMFLVDKELGVNPIEAEWK